MDLHAVHTVHSRLNTAFRQPLCQAVPEIASESCSRRVGDSALRHPVSCKIRDYCWRVMPWLPRRLSRARSLRCCAAGRQATVRHWPVWPPSLTTTCAPSPPATCGAKMPVTPCRPPAWSTRCICGWRRFAAWNSPTAATSSPSRPQLMRMVLIDHARQAHAQKRSGHHRRVPLHDEMAWIDASNDDLLALDAALDQLEAARRTQSAGHRTPLLPGLHQRRGGWPIERVARHHRPRSGVQPRLVASPAGGPAWSCRLNSDDTPGANRSAVPRSSCAARRRRLSPVVGGAMPGRSRTGVRSALAAGVASGHCE